MVYKEVNEIPIVHTRAIIINVSTRLCTTLAILSVKKRTNLPLLVVDCPYQGKSDFAELSKLSEEYDFDLIQLPLRHHGHTLDYIFSNINADNLVLLDSDAEIIDGEFVDEMVRLVDTDFTFGSGFTHGPCTLHLNSFYAMDTDEEGLYAERMWIPFCVLKVDKIREALSRGMSFVDNTRYNIIPQSQKLSKFLYKHFPDWCMSNFARKFKSGNGRNECNVVYYDTGAEIFEYLKNVRYYWFFGQRINYGVHEKYIHHYEGITRKLISEGDDKTAFNIDDVVELLKTRMKDIYGYYYY